MTATKLVEIKRQAQRDLKDRGLDQSVRDLLEQLVTVSDKLLERIARKELTSS